jgi:hypothetical protein
MNLKHIGSFRLPAGRQPHDPALAEPLRQYAKLGFGGRAMSMMYQGNKALLISGHNIGDLVAAVRIPELGETAEVRIGFRELVPAAELFVNRLDELVGVAEHQGRVVGLFHQFYQVSGVDGGRVSFFDGERLVQLGDGELKKHAGFLTSHDGKLYVGRSSGAGNADINHGPCLYEVLPHSFGLIERFRHVRPDWSEADDYTALAFLPGHACWLVSKDVAVEPWYGTGSEVDKEHRNPPDWFTPSYALQRGVSTAWHVEWQGETEWRAAWEAIGIRDLWSDSKGYHCETRGVWLLAYKWPIVPGDEGEIVKLDGFHESSDAGGMAYDGGTGRLYVHEGYPPDETTERGVYPKEKGKIHVYQAGAGVASEPDPVTEPDEVPVELTIGSDRYRGMMWKETRG